LYSCSEDELKKLKPTLFLTWLIYAVLNRVLASDGTRDDIYLGGIDLCKTTGSKVKPHVQEPAVSSSFVDLSTTSDDPTVPAVSSSSVASDLTALDLTVDDVWGMDPSSPAIVANAFNIAISVAMLHLLKGTEWLSDEILNFYFGMIVARCPNEEVYAFSTHFFTKLFLDSKPRAYNYDKVATWSNKFDPFTLDKIFVPINLPGHWTFIIVYIRKKWIHFYDSMHKNGAQYRDAIMKWLEQEANNRAFPFDRGQWETKDGDSPSQKGNGTECGVFTLMSADILSVDMPLASDTFGLAEMPQFRRQIARDILRGKLDGDDQGT